MIRTTGSFGRRLIRVFICISLALITIIIGTPHYLRYADQPAPADVIVLFVGPENTQRRARALALLRAGYADTLFIPAYRSILSQAGADDAERVMIRTTDRVSWLDRNRRARYPSHYEQTHMEVLIARDFMAERGFRTAIFVSSPYHLRRIRAITLSTITGVGERIRFVPASASGDDSCLWLLNKSYFEWVCSEYVKLAWFWLYRHADGLFKLFHITI